MVKKQTALIASAILILGIFFYFFEGDQVIDYVDDLNSTTIINSNPSGKIEERVKNKEVDDTLKSLKNKNELDLNNLDLNLDNLEGLASAELFKKRKIIPYDKEKPPMPDEEENNSTLYGVDANGNGVRDDLEIMTIDKFGYDRDLVESIFAGIRTYDYGIYVVENNLIEDRGVMKEVINNIDRMVSCNYLYSGNLDDGESIYNSYGNTQDRIDKIKYLARNLYGVADDFVTNEKTCKEFFEKTKEYDFR